MSDDRQGRRERSWASPDLAELRAGWSPIEERRAQIARWKAEAKFSQRERDRWADDGGRAP